MTPFHGHLNSLCLKEWQALSAGRVCDGWWETQEAEKLNIVISLLRTGGVHGAWPGHRGRADLLNTYIMDGMTKISTGRSNFGRMFPLTSPLYHLQFSSVHSLSHVQLFATPWTAARQASLYVSNSQSLPKLMSIESVMPSNHIILCRPLLLLPSIFPSIRVFSNKSALDIRWPKYWSFSFNISPYNEHPGVISFWMDWLGLNAVQGTLESSPTRQFKSINSSVLSFLYSPTLTSIHDYWKNHCLD